MATVVCGCTASSQSMDSSTYLIELSQGRTLSEMIDGIQSLIPNSLELFPGNSIEVPNDIRATDRDLAIHCKDISLINGISVCFFDTINDTWVGPTVPATSYMDASQEWLIWVGFLNVVIPFKSRINLKLTGHIIPVAPGQPTTLQLIQPPCDKNLSLELEVYSDPDFTEPVVTIDTAEPSEDFPVAVCYIDHVSDFPNTGVTDATAGNFIAIDLSKLEYTSKVYIKWTWRIRENSGIYKTGVTIYPALSATTPASIGYVIEEQ